MSDGDGYWDRCRRATFCVLPLLAFVAGHTAAADGAAALKAQRADSLAISQFYRVERPLPAKPPGTLIRTERADFYSVPPAINAVRIAYLSRSAEDKPVVTTGIVLIPFGAPPAGGWPVIAWAHGTSGVAQDCAPSLMKDLYYGWEGLFEYPMMGYAVVATDYAGLGTDGPHEYMSIAAQAHDVIYSIPAARAAVPQLGPRWVAVGHSQGGAAVLKVADLEHGLRDPNFLGTVSLAPPTDFSDLWHQHTDANPAAAGYLDMIALGIYAVDPAFEPQRMLGKAALAILPEVEHEACLEAASALLADAPPREILQPHWADLPAVVHFARANRPDARPGYGPVLLLQGTADQTIPQTLTDRAAVNLCRLGDRLEYQTYAGMDHDPLVYASFKDQIHWIAERFGGRPAPTNCRAVLR
jgi:alpha-beta hydrolase superfamily lysophospholipase